MEKYDLIYADPPWSYRNKGSRAKAENHYATMSLSEIKEYPIPVAENCILFMWATSPMLPEALEVIRAWGFQYKSSFAWDKEIIGLGNWNRNQHELLLIAVKGKVKPPPPVSRHSSVIRSRRKRHSAKPEVVYEILEAMYPNTKKIELFARKRRKRWDSVGDQLPE